MWRCSDGVFSRLVDVQAAPEEPQVVDEPYSVPREVEAPTAQDHEAVPEADNIYEEPPQEPPQVLPEPPRPQTRLRHL